MKNFIDYEKLERLSQADKNVPLYKKIIKLQEEAGEVAQEFLAYDDKQNGIKTNSSKSAEGTIEAVIEEVCDATNVCIDILNALEMQNPQLSGYITKRFQEKLDKWESKIVASSANSTTITPIRTCSNCKFLDTTVTLTSNPPQYICKSPESKVYSVGCDKTGTYTCDFHELQTGCKKIYVYPSEFAISCTSQSYDSFKK